MKTKVEAVQITYWVKLPEWALDATTLSDWIPGAVRIDSSFPNKVQFKVRQAVGWVKGKAGDWLVREHNGLHSVCREDDFHKNFDLITPEAPMSKYEAFITEVVVADGIEDKNSGIKITIIRYHGGRPADITLTSTSSGPVVIRNAAQWDALKKAIDWLKVLE